MSNPYGVTEVDDNFFNVLQRAQEAHAEAVFNATAIEHGLSVLEKDLMKESARDVMSATGAKSVPEFVQRRDAKSHVKYREAVMALASAQRELIICRGRVDSLKMQFEAWRTRQANRRSGNG